MPCFLTYVTMCLIAHEVNNISIKEGHKKKSTSEIQGHPFFFFSLFISY